MTPTLRRWFGVSWLAVGLTLLLAPLGAHAQTTSVLVARVEATITPVIADHLREGIERAERDGHAAFIIELDTPGGLDTSMRSIIQSILGSRVPVVVHVAPSGARAASAGAMITIASHVAAMSPGTAIGAATPVDLEGGDISRKIINDAAAYAESLARLRGRNVEFAVDAVREGRSVGAEEAVRIGAVDLIARDRSDLLARIDGRKVTLTAGQEVTLRTAGATIETYDLRGFRRLLQWLADPNLAFLFMSLGTLGIIYELANPGLGAAGIVGVILIILALFALSVLPVNAIGAIMVFLGAILFVAEVFTPGVGAFAAGGTAALLLGGLFLFRGGVGVDLFVLLPVTAVAGATAVGIGRLAWRTRSKPVAPGVHSPVGSKGTVSYRGDTMQIFTQGAWWRARSDTPLAEGQRVRVTGVDDLDLIVEPEQTVASDQGDET